MQIEVRQLPIHISISAITFFNSLWNIVVISNKFKVVIYILILVTRLYRANGSQISNRVKISVTNLYSISKQRSWLLVW